jgi:DNA-directed RNA polymerase specialized sigma subunit
VDISTVSALVKKLQNNQPVTQKDYLPLLIECRRIVVYMFRRYKLYSIITKKDLQEDVIDEVTIIALLKALRGYDERKGSKFQTYYFSKARSLMEVKQKYYFRRYSLINSLEYKDEITEDESVSDL